LVKTFVALHGGTVLATSPGLGLGSDFVVSLPLAENPGDQPDTASVAPSRRLIPGTEGVRVLLVDDNIDLLQSMEILLKESGFTVAAAPGAVEALQIAESFKPTVVVLDIGLPAMDGYELANELRLRLCSPKPRLLALFGYGQESDQRRSRAAGIERHLVKPVQFADLVSAPLERQS